MSNAVALPADGHFAHIVKSVALGNVRTKCGIRIHAITTSREEAASWGYSICGKCEASKGTATTQTVRCSDCNTKLNSKEIEICTDCKATREWKAR